jgi:putative flippase GtrA
MTLPNGLAREGALAAKCCGVSLLGFCVDLALLHAMLWMGLQPAWGRVVSLLCAMHVTFVVNGLHVFRQLDRRRFVGQWVRYMLSNGLGNVCNYWIFVTLVSTHWSVIASPLFAVGAGSIFAWVINFCATRFFVFPRRRRLRASLSPGNDPSPTLPGSSRP